MTDAQRGVSRHAVYGGTFDPPTFGHIDLIARAALQFDRLTVGVGTNVNKKVLFSVEERLAFLNESLKDYKNVTVCAYSGLLVDFCRQTQAQVIVRGLRAVADFEYEFQMALANRDLDPSIETMFLIAATERLFLSSSVVKEIAANDRDVRSYVPACVADVLASRVIANRSQSGQLSNSGLDSWGED